MPAASEWAFGHHGIHCSLYCPRLACSSDRGTRHRYPSPDLLYTITCIHILLNSSVLDGNQDAPRCQKAAHTGTECFVWPYVYANHFSPQSPHCWWHEIILAQRPELSVSSQCDKCSSKPPHKNGVVGCTAANMSHNRCPACAK